MVNKHQLHKRQLKICFVYSESWVLVRIIVVECFVRTRRCICVQPTHAFFFSMPPTFHFLPVTKSHTPFIHFDFVFPSSYCFVISIHALVYCLCRLPFYKCFRKSLKNLFLLRERDYKYLESCEILCWE